MLAIGLVAIPGTALPQSHLHQTTIAGMSHVRSGRPDLLALIARAGEQSLTFRGLVETIDASDGFVYVEPGACRHGLRACLVKVASVGAHRFVFVKIDVGKFVKVDVDKMDRELMASIGHELRHAVEVLSDPEVRDGLGLYFLYKSKRERGTSSATASAFETAAAIQAGQAVADEIRRFQRAK
jgi:hypothetical protein